MSTPTRTSVDRAYDALEAARNRLYVATGERLSAKALGKIVTDIAEAEGRHATVTQVWHLIDRCDLTPADAVAEVTRQALTTGADDTWSGRGNDVARARFDGVLSVLADYRGITS